MGRRAQGLRAGRSTASRKNVHSMSDTCLKYNKEIKDLFELERYFFEFLGFELKSNKTNINKYLSGFDSFFNIKEDNK